MDIFKKGVAASPVEAAVAVERGSKIPSLDGWRAIAIALVLASHMWASVGSPAFGSIWPNLGNFGVRIFFTLSGFLFTWLLLVENKRYACISLRAFYMRRIYRIFPVYYTYLAVLAVAQIAGFYNDVGTTWLGALTFTRNIIGQGDSATGHLWSLAVEEQFYLIWPCLLVFARFADRQRIALLVLSLVIIAAIVARPISCLKTNLICRTILHHNSALRYADCLAIGCFGAFARNRWQPTARHSQSIAPLAALILAISVFFETGLRPWCATILVDIQSWLAIAAMIFSAESGKGVFYRFLNSKIIIFFGTISYSLYIWHLLFLRKYVGPDFPLGIFSDWKFWWLAAIATATLSYYAFEQPILRFGRRWKR